MIARREPPFVPVPHWAILAVQYLDRMSPNRRTPKLNFGKISIPCWARHFGVPIHSISSRISLFHPKTAHTARETIDSRCAHGESPLSWTEFRMYKIIKKRAATDRSGNRPNEPNGNLCGLYVFAIRM